MFLKNLMTMNKVIKTYLNLVALCCENLIITTRLIGSEILTSLHLESQFNDSFQRKRKFVVSHWVIVVLSVSLVMFFLFTCAVTFSTVFKIIVFFSQKNHCRF